MLFRCTGAMRKMLGLKDSELTEAPTVDNDVFEWYCHQFWIERRKCILFTHAITLFSFVVPGVRKEDLRDFLVLFHESLLPNLIVQGFSSEAIASFPVCAPVRFAKTRNRSIVGSMNDFVHLGRVHVEMDGGIACADFGDVNRELNMTPMGGIGMEYPVDMMKSLLATSLAQIERSR